MMMMEQADAALTIKRIHSVLRKEVKKGGNVEEIWQDHKTNNKNLQIYSDAMVSLANIWQDSHPLSENRVEWCMEICREYFWKGGLQNYLEKDLRKNYYDSLRTGRITSAQSLESFVAENHEFVITRDYFCNRRLDLLDVGSCYNPFKKFADEILVLPIDLHPATDEVFHGDFLELEITDNFENVTGPDKRQSSVVGNDPLAMNLSSELLSPIAGNKASPKRESFPDETTKQSIYPLDRSRNTMRTSGNIHFNSNDSVTKSDSNQQFIPNMHKLYLTNPLKRLPPEAFDVIVFSLVLSYLPTQRQRWDCCIKSNKLLRDNGLLILIESDSAHQHRNAHQIRAWKHALTGIGFVRYRYEKLMHLHCMAFRKKTNVDLLIKEGRFVDNSSMMFIPQDFHDEDEEVKQTTFAKRTDEEDEEVCCLFNALPDAI